MNKFTSDLKKVLPGHNKDGGNTAADKGSPMRNRLNLDMIRNQGEPELSKNMYLLIKSEGHIRDSYSAAGRERSSFAVQMRDWGLGTEDDALAEITEGLSALLAEVAETENRFTNQLEESRVLLKGIRNIERDAGRTRQDRDRNIVELERLKQKEGQSPRTEELERNLTRAQASTLVADSQMKTVTRKQLKLAYDVHLAAMSERSERQSILARHMRSLMLLVDDSTVRPDETRRPFTESNRVREIVNDAKRDLRAWEPTHEAIPTNPAVKIGDTMTPVSGDSTQSPTTAIGTGPRVEPVGRESHSTNAERLPATTESRPARGPEPGTTRPEQTTTERLHTTAEPAPAYTEPVQARREPVEQHFDVPVQSRREPVGQSYNEPERRHDEPVQQRYNEPVQPHREPVQQHYNEPVQSHREPVAQSYNEPVQSHRVPLGQSYNEPVQQRYNEPGQQLYNEPVQQRHNEPVPQQYNEPVPAATRQEPATAERILAATQPAPDTTGRAPGATDSGPTRTVR